MDFFLEPFAHEFMLRALFAGVVVGGLCALIGVFVVQRGLSFVGDGLAHAAFGGIALGLLANVTVGELDVATQLYLMPAGAQGCVSVKKELFR